MVHSDSVDFLPTQKTVTLSADQTTNVDFSVSPTILVPVTFDVLLPDTTPDDAGLVTGLRDRANGGAYPSGDAGARAIYQAIRDMGTTRISLRKLWKERLAPIWGDAGAEVLTMNGVPVGKWE